MPNSIGAGRGDDGSPETLRCEAMSECDLERVLAIEQLSFPSPWQRRHFEHELHENPSALNLVLRGKQRLLGYACLWCIEDELTLNNIAVDPAYRGRGLAHAFLRAILAVGRRRGCRTAALDVRPSNVAARRLYAAHGFVEVGRRRNYYQLEGEDSILMTAVLAPKVD